MPVPTYLQQVQFPRPGHLGGGSWKIDALTGVTVLFGRNGSGKSEMLRAWRTSKVGDAHYIAPERTGDLGFQPQLMTEELGHQQRANYSSTNWISNYRQRVLARLQTYLMQRGNVRGAVAPVDPGDLEKLLASLATDFAFSIVVENPPFHLTRLSTGGRVGGSGQELSSGEAQALTLGIDVLTMAGMWEIEKRPARLLLIDEPDAHLHPDLQVRLADFLVRVGAQFAVQIVVATHSTTLLTALAHFAEDEASVVYVDRSKGEQRARRITREMREMAGVLGGHVLMGPLFGAPLLLVEGDDDYRIWSQVPRHHVIQLAVIPCEGDGIAKAQLSLERLLGCISEPPARPIGYALRDGDKALPTPTPDNAQAYIRYLRLSCREAENLYLSDEVLAALSLTWDEAAAKIASVAPAAGAKSERLSAAPTWERSKIDLKGLMPEMEEALDAKRLPWTLRVGNVIGAAKPVGQLASFLGAETVAALWP